MELELAHVAGAGENHSPCHQIHTYEREWAAGPLAMTRYGLHDWFLRARDGRTSVADPTPAWDTLQTEECGPSRGEVVVVAVDDGPFRVQRQTWYGYGEEPGATLARETADPSLYRSDRSKTSTNFGGAGQTWHAVRRKSDVTVGASTSGRAQMDADRSYRPQTVP